MNIWVLRFWDYSVVLPLTSLTYIWTMVLSYIILKEKISAKKIVGVILILAGAILVSLQNDVENRKDYIDPELLDVKRKLSKKTENKICYINYSRNSKIQYKTQYSVALYVWMDRFLDACGTNLDIDSYIELVQGVIDGDENTYKDLYNMLSFQTEDKDKFFHDAFVVVYENDVTDEWKPKNLNQYENNYEIFKGMIQGDSFKSMVGLYR